MAGERRWRAAKIAGLKEIPVIVKEFTEQEVVDYTSAKSSDTKAFSEYFKGMLAQGIHMAPSQFEAMFLSVAHTDEIIDQTLEAVRNYFTK